MLQISAPIQPGNSGGPVLDNVGNLVGIVVAKLDALKYAAPNKDVAQNINFSIKAAVAVNFLEMPSQMSGNSLQPKSPNMQNASQSPFNASDRQIPYCLPPGVNKEQAARVFVQYARNNTQLLHFPPATLLMASLAQAFPCANQ
jgi:S1-C subfamily serine protease